MASSGKSKLGTVLALAGGAIGIGIVIYALMQDQEPAQVASVSENEAVSGNVSEGVPQADEATSADVPSEDNASDVAAAPETAPTEQTEPASDGDASGEAVALLDDDERSVGADETSSEPVQDAPNSTAATPDVVTPEPAEDATQSADEELVTSEPDRPEPAEVPSETGDTSVASTEREATPAPESVEQEASETAALPSEETPRTEPENVDTTETSDESPSETASADLKPEETPAQTTAPEAELTVDAPQSTVEDQPDAPVVVAAIPEGADEAPDLDPNDPAVPKFDLVRVEADGSAVIAGRAEPDAEVTIYSNGEVIGSAVASSRGEFVALVDTEISETAQSLALLADNPSGPTVASRSSVILLGREQTSGIEEEDATVNLAPAIIQTSRDEVRVIQPVVGLADLDRVSLDSISYDQEGQVILAGRGRPENIARIYADQALVSETPISQSGTWSVVLNDLDAGRYVLRVDEIDEEGKVLSRVESPFQREFPSAEKLALLGDEKQVIVQPGNNLWTIAELRYGEGFRYTVIFEANKDQIRDPDLIYPGQVFELPQDSQ